MAEYRSQHWKGSFEGETRRARKGGSYETYLPDTLCHRTFLLHGETAADISDAERAVISLNNQAKALRNTEALARLVLRAEALSSSKIEGLVIGPRRILKAELDRSAHDETAMEVLNNITAMDEALSEAALGPITVGTMQRIHEKLLSGTRLAPYAGIVRTEQNWFGGNSYNPCGAAYVPPPHKIVPDLLEDLASFCNEDSLPPLAQAAIAHAQFETIHPFVDGNGRVGRALVHVILRRRGLCPSVVPPISLAIATRGQAYIAELSLFRHIGPKDGAAALEGINSWLSFFSACTISACKNAAAFEANVNRAKQGWLDAVGKRTSTLEDFADAMAGRPVFSAATMMQATGKSLPTVNAAIERFVQAGAVKQINMGKRNRAFEAAGIVEAFIGFERAAASPADDTSVSRPARPVPFPPSGTKGQ